MVRTGSQFDRAQAAGSTATCGAGRLRQEIQRRNKGYFIDIYRAMLGNDGQPDSSLFIEDGLHVSPKGYRVWEKLLNSRSGDIFDETA